MQSPEQRRAQLLSWIAETRRNQRRFAIGLAIATALSFALMLWRTDVGEAGLGIVAISAVCGFWITASHITEWRSLLAELDRTDPPV